MHKLYHSIKEPELRCPLCSNCAPMFFSTLTKTIRSECRQCKVSICLTEMPSYEKHR